MNNQFATQFLLEEMDAYDSLRSMLADLGAEEDSIKVLVKAVEMGALKPSEAVEIVKKALNIDETSTVGGGVAGGPAAATFTSGTGEQVAGTKKAFKKKYQEDAPRLAGDPSKTNKQGTKNLTTYKNFGFTKAPSAEEAGKDIEGVDVKMLWKEGAEGREFHPKVERFIKHVADRALSKELHKDFHDEVMDDLHSGKFDENTSLGDFKKYLIDKVAHFADRYTEGLNESRAYHKFKKETATRSKDQQMHEAVRMIHSRLAEVSKLLEYAQQMRNELSEGEQTLEYNHNTKKIFERINSKVVEIYSKTRQLK